MIIGHRSPSAGVAFSAPSATCTADGNTLASAGEYSHGTVCHTPGRPQHARQCWGVFPRHGLPAAMMRKKRTAFCEAKTKEFCITTVFGYCPKCEKWLCELCGWWHPPCTNGPTNKDSRDRFMAVLKKRGPQTKAQSKELVIAKMKEDIQDLREHQNRLQASEEATSSTKMTNEQKNKAQASSAAASSSSSARPAGMALVPKAATHDKGGFRDDESKMDRKAMGRKATKEFVMGRFREWEARPPWFSPRATTAGPR